MDSNKKSLIKGVSILGIYGLICKIIGVIFRIPLALIIGDDGLGVYQLVFPTYAMLLTISSAGIPVAISHGISSALAVNDKRTAEKTFKVALILLSALGLITTIFMVLNAGFLSERVGNPKTKMGFITIAPSLFIVCVMSAFRGYTQGQRDMKPTAISQLLEQIGKVALALPLAYIGMKSSVVNAAAGALLGTSLAELLALVYIFFAYRKDKRSDNDIVQNASLPEQNNKSIAINLIKMAVPITIGACVVPLSGFVDSAMLVNRMRDIGFSIDEASRLYGLYSGLVITLINVPTALAVAISMTLVPTISSAMSAKRYDSVQRQSLQGLRYAFLIGLPCSFGMSVLAKPILHFFYSSLGVESVNTASSLLQVSSFTILLFTVVQATSGILQGLKHERIPMYTLALGVLIKIILNYYFVGQKDINIYGAPYASIVCYTISMIPNIYYVNKYCNIKFDWMACAVRPGLACIVMWLLLKLLSGILPFGRISTIILIVIGMVVFMFFAYIFKAITKEDLSILFRRRHA